MKALLQAGLSGRAPAPPEKRSLIFTDVGSNVDCRHPPDRIRVDLRHPNEALRMALAKRDPALLMAAITDKAVEQQVLDRVAAKAGTYTADLNRNATTPTVAPEVITTIYRDWIIPLNKQVQVEYLLLPRG